MKIVLLISSIHSKSSGLGGHYHSLVETAKQLDKEHDVVIVNIGTDPAKTLEHAPVKVHRVIHKKPAILRILRELNAIVRTERPDVLHSFDRIAHYWGRIVSRRHGMATFLTKCGGPNDKYYPFADNLVLYSLENRLHFESLKKFRDAHLYLVPNRIAHFPDDEERIGEIRKALSEKGLSNAFTFLRITRIGGYYLHSSLQLMNLVRRLRADGIDCCAVFIGTVQEAEVLAQLQEGFGDSAVFFTDEYYSKNAKALIGAAHAVLGTGRSLMEASSKHKALLCPTTTGDYPVLLNESNFPQAFFYNFSERTAVDDPDAAGYAKIAALTNEGEAFAKACEFSRRMFETHFDSSGLTEKYNELYGSRTKTGGRRVADFILHTALVVKTYLKK